MKIRPVGAELFRSDRRTNRHDEANSRFSQFLRTRTKSASVSLQAAEIHAEKIYGFQT